MEPLTLLHRLEIERRQAPAHRHLVEARRARATARRARLQTRLWAVLPERATATPAAQPCC